MSIHSFCSSSLCVLLFISHAVCANASEIESHPSRYRISNVPQVVQERDYCGPAALSAVFQFWGLSRSQDELAEKLSTRHRAGSLNIDLLLAARDEGFDARGVVGNFDELKSLVAHDIPVIVLLRLNGFFSGLWHYAVVVGYDETADQIVTHAGEAQETRFSANGFLKAWSKGEYWMLVVRPKAKAQREGAR